MTREPRTTHVNWDAQRWPRSSPEQRSYVCLRWGQFCTLLIFISAKSSSGVLGLRWTYLDPRYCRSLQTRKSQPQPFTDINGIDAPM